MREQGRRERPQADPDRRQRRFKWYIIPCVVAAVCLCLIAGVLVLSPGSTEAEDAGATDAPTEEAAVGGSWADSDTEAEPSALTVSLGAEDLTLMVTAQKQLTAAVSDENGEERTDSNPVTWASSDPEVVSVSDDGTITALAEGTAQITASLSSGESASLSVTVLPLNVAEKTVFVQPGDVLTISELGLLPEEMEWTEFQWSCSNEKVAAVSAGEITILSDGEAEIRGTGDTASISCTVTTCFGGKLIAHRGLSGEAPENTVPAFQLAGQAGAWGIETDIVSTSDGVLVCLHDDTIDAMTDGSGRVSGFTYEELMQYHIDAGSNVDQYQDLTIPTFQEYLEICREYDAVAVIELKTLSSTAQVRTVYETICACGMEEQCIVISFQYSYLQALRSYTQDIPVQLVVNAASRTNIAQAATLENSGIDFKTGSETLIAYAHSLHCTTNVWTVDTASAQESWRAAGIDFITANSADWSAGASPDDGDETDSNAEESDGEPITLFFASDYQAEDGWPAPSETLTGLLEVIYGDGYAPDNVILCGDYTNLEKKYNYETSPDDSIAEIKSIFGAFDPDLDMDDMIFVQGNHDAMSSALTETGLYEFDDYLVYVIDTQNAYPWKQGSLGLSAIVQNTAENLAACLDDLIEAGETRPLIIAGHVPLHFSARTSSLHTTGDNLYASYIFDVVNEAGQSLDIIYLFGHNHSKGWDSYLGGSCVYQGVGDTVLIPTWEEGDVDTETYSEETLSFTYLNAGYLGYCSDSGADDTLTCTVCQIYSDKIVLTRYSTDGIWHMGADGAANPYRDDTGLISSSLYSEETESPQVIIRKNAAE
ncbi:MAG: Ig-like domain-containing protein [Clostridiales bacterium]|nr:Ig-like domain-containing protein [Clostridiales bacterium]